ncbi:hypothetical protein STEG23_033134, partial [Scotinomys teguina]
MKRRCRSYRIVNYHQSFIFSFLFVHCSLGYMLQGSCPLGIVFNEDISIMKGVLSYDFIWTICINIGTTEVLPDIIYDETSVTTVTLPSSGQKSWATEATFFLFCDPIQAQEACCFMDSEQCH